MQQSTFLKLAGALQVLWGLFFIFRGGDVIAWFIIGACASTRLFPTGLGVFVLAFGALSWSVASRPGGPAIRAILFATLFYLMISMAVDAWWVLQGVLTSWTWGSIAMRGIVASGYAWYALLRAGRITVPGRSRLPP